MKVRIAGQEVEIKEGGSNMGTPTNKRIVNRGKGGKNFDNQRRKK